jgi:hypothetical protein
MDRKDRKDRKEHKLITLLESIFDEFGYSDIIGVTNDIIEVMEKHNIPTTIDGMINMNLWNKINPYNVMTVLSGLKNEGYKVKGNIPRLVAYGAYIEQCEFDYGSRNCLEDWDYIINNLNADEKNQWYRNVFYGFDIPEAPPAPRHKTYSGRRYSSRKHSSRKHSSRKHSSRKIKRRSYVRKDGVRVRATSYKRK